MKVLLFDKKLNFVAKPTCDYVQKKLDNNENVGHVKVIYTESIDSDKSFIMDVDDNSIIIENICTIEEKVNI